MTAVDRYLSRVALWLPTTMRLDVVAELREALMERIEAAEAQRGRPLDDSEARQVVAGFGHPAIVVSRYVHGSPVISGQLAFFFWRVLAIALIGVLTSHALALLVQACDEGLTWSALDHAARRVSVALLLAFTCVTASFMIIQRRYGR
jgi:hypothetical protein